MSQESKHALSNPERGPNQDHDQLCLEHNGTAHSSSSHVSSKDTIADHGSLERVPTAHDAPSRAQAVRTTTTASAAGPVHSVFTTHQKWFIVFMASWAGFFSPVSANIYFPALVTLAKDLNVSNTLMNLTLTSYMVGSSRRGERAKIDVCRYSKDLLLR